MKKRTAKYAKCTFKVVRGQYGSDSDQAQAVGLKKKSARKRPSRKKVVAMA
jgi:hypothetical protein